MTIEGLAFVKSTLEKAGIPYCFGVWSEEVTYPYFVGDYAETEPLYEYGESERKQFLIYQIFQKALLHSETNRTA